MSRSSSDSDLEQEVKVLEAEAERSSYHGYRFLETLLRLGTAYFENGQIEEAEGAILRVRKDMAKIWGWEHRLSQRCVWCLTKIYIARDDLDAAVSLYSEAIDGVRRALGSQHPWTSQLQNTAGCLHVKRRDWAQAATLFEQSLTAKKTVFGVEHRATLKTELNLALVKYCKGGRTEDYELAVDSTLQSLLDLHGDTDVETIQLARQLMSLYFKTENAHAGHQVCRTFSLDRKYFESLKELEHSDLRYSASKRRFSSRTLR